MSEQVQLLDVNVLIALANPPHVHHAPAHDWFLTVRLWATTPLTETAFLRLQTNPRVTGGVTTVPQALAALRAMRNAPGRTFLPDRSSLSTPSVQLAGLVGHRQVTDFHLVTLAAEQGAVLATFDAAISAALVGEDKQHVHVIPV